MVLEMATHVHVQVRVCASSYLKDIIIQSGDVPDEVSIGMK
jgi:hypothetical protein